MPGVLFEGGSFRPIFSCGVMDALLDQDIMFPYCIGVSAGAADSASYISRQKGRNLRVLTRYRNDKRYMGKRNFLKKERSMFGIQFAFRDLPNKIDPFDMKTFQAYEGKYVIVTTDANTGETCYFGKEDVDRQYNVLCATCALPVFFPAIEIGGKKYYDGGLSNPIPIDKMVDDGNEKALVVLTRPKGFRKECGKRDRMAAKMVYRKYPVIAEQLLTRYHKYNESVAICEQMEREGKVIILRPEESIDSFESDVEVLKKFYQQGYDMAVKRMQEIRSLFE